MDYNIKRSERIKNQNSKKYSIINNQIMNLIKNISTLNQIEKINRFLEIYQCINTHFDFMYENNHFLTKGISFFYIVFFLFQKKIGFLEKERKNGKSIWDRYLKQSKVLDNKCLQLFENKLKSKSFFYKEKKEETCPICLESILKKDFFITKCNHCFHKNCLINHLLQQTCCPMCRKDLF